MEQGLQKVNYHTEHHQGRRWCDNQRLFHADYIAACYATDGKIYGIGGTPKVAKPKVISVANQKGGAGYL